MAVAVETSCALLLRPMGLGIRVAGNLAGILALWRIGPKQKAVSAEYGAKQRGHLEHLETDVTSESPDGSGTQRVPFRSIPAVMTWDKRMHVSNAKCSGTVAAWNSQANW